MLNLLYEDLEHYGVEMPNICYISVLVIKNFIVKLNENKLFYWTY